MITAAPAQKKLIAITFDDGPSSVTGRLLDGLKARGAKATFFMLGSLAAQYPNTVRRAYEEGHQICNHSYDHPALTTKTNEQIYWQLSKTDSILDEVLGMDFHYTVRPPYGDVNSRVHAILRDSFDSASIIWSVDPYDWRDRNSYTVANRVVSGSFDGAIVLVHDIYGSTVTGILSAIDTLKDYGYEFVTLAELFRRRGKVMTPGENIHYCKPTGTDLGPVEAPVISETVTYGSRELVMSAQPGATIYYTTDGSNPVYSNLQYTQPLTLSPGTTVRAVAAYNLNGSRSESVTYQTSFMPAWEPVAIEILDGKIHMKNPNEGTDLRISTDGTAVNGESALYTEPLDLFDGELRYCILGEGFTGPEMKLYVTKNGNLFRDVPTNEWYAPTVDRAVTEGIFNGMGDFRFAPTKGVNRAMFVTVLYRLMEKLGANVSYELPATFPDATEQWYLDALSWSSEQGIVMGYTDGTFAPDKEITREEMCTMLSRVLQWYGCDLPEGGDDFADSEEISAWAYADVLAMSGMELILGYEDETFRPRNTATRAQSATVLLRAYDLLSDMMENEQEPLPEDPTEPAPEEPTEPQPEEPTEPTPEDPTESTTEEL